MVMFSDKVSVPAHVLVRFLDKEAVLLNIETERYFGLDQTGARMWQLATTATNIDAAYQALLSEYDVDGETLREHLSELLEKLADNGLLTVTRRFRALEPNARGLFLRAAVLLPFISLSLRLRGFRATQLSLQKRLAKALTGISDQSSRAQAASIALTARMVRSAAHRSWGSPACLEQSLALWWLLGRQGIASSVRIGTRKSEAKFEAHAWVECDGVAINEPEDAHKHYAAFDEAFPVLKAAKK
jgi:hypothetical protein